MTYFKGIKSDILRKTDFAELYAIENGICHVDAARIIDSVFNLIGQQLNNGFGVRLTGIGVLYPKDVSARIIRTHFSAGLVKRKEKRTVKFKPGVEIVKLLTKNKNLNKQQKG